MMAEVLLPGSQTTLQDLGRVGWQRYGVCVCGAMDPLACRVTNLLVGNAENTPVLEVAMLGPKLLFHDEAVVAVGGADFCVLVKQHPIRLWESCHVPSEAVLEFRERKAGFRAYLAVAGGFVSDEVFSSCSTDVRVRWGGRQGRALQKGDRLEWNAPARGTAAGRRARADLAAEYRPPGEIRVVLGPDDRLFSSRSIERFLSCAYTVTPQSDRQGYRLRGPSLEEACLSDRLSQAIPPGAIQVPSGGQPILLMADRQSVGGYPKIACCIAADIPKAAQLAIGDSVRFRAVSLQEAHRALRLQKQRITDCCYQQ